MNENDLNKVVEEGGEVNHLEKMAAIQENLAILKNKMESTRRERAQFVVKKVQDREKLLRQLEESEGTRNQAQALLDSLAPLRVQEGLAEDPEFQRQVKEATELVSGIVAQQAEINLQIAKIEGHPDVIGALHDTANEMNTAVDKEKETEKKEELFRKEAELFAKEVAQYALRYDNYFVRQAELGALVQKNGLDAVEVLDASVGMIKGDTLTKNDIFALKNKIQYFESLEAFDRKFEEIIKRKIGMFGHSGDKNAIEYLNEHREGVFNEYRKAIISQADLKGEFVVVQKMKEALVKKYRGFEVNSSLYAILADEVKKESKIVPGGSYKRTVDAFHEVVG